MILEAYDRTFPLSLSQQNIWNLERTVPGTSINNICTTIRIQGRLDFLLLQKSLNLLLQADRSLRAQLTREDSTPLQYYVPYEEQRWEVYDFSHTSAESIQSWEQAVARERIPLFHAPLYRFYLFRSGENQGGVVVKTHHLISDGWSQVLLCNRIADLYRRFLAGETPELPKIPAYPLHLEEEAAYQKSPAFQKDQAYWQKTLQQAGEPSALKPVRTAVMSPVGRRVSFLLPQVLSHAIRQFCQENRVAPFAVFYMALAIYFKRIGGENRFTIGVPIVNRTTFQMKQCTGMFVNTLPFCNEISEQWSLRDFNRQLMEAWYELLRHQRFPFSQITRIAAEEQGRPGRLFQIAFSYQDSQVYESPDATVTFSGRWHYSGYQMEQLCIHLSNHQDNRRYSLDYDYLTQLFCEEEIHRLHQRLCNILQEALAEPDRPLCRLSVLSANEQEQVLYTFNRTGQLWKEEDPYTLFQRTVQEFPDRAAVITGGRRVTYRQLNLLAEQIAAILSARFPDQENALFAVLLPKGSWMMAALLGILRAGHAYLILSPEWPLQRMRKVLADSGAAALLMEQADSFPEMAQVCGVPVLPLSQLAQPEAPASASGSSILPEGRAASPAGDSLAYVVYTSGSTGEPKGIEITRRGLLNFAKAMGPVYGKGAILSVCSPAFDAFVIESIAALFNGRTLVFPEPGEEESPRALAACIRRYGAGFLSTTPSRLSALLKDPDFAQAMRTMESIVCGGESYPGELLQRLKDCTHARLYNQYGPSEATVAVAMKQLNEASAITAGRPLPNCRLYVLDSWLNPLPVGVTGTLYISGSCLGRGYRNAPELTEASFIPNPFETGERMYNTGDLASWTPEGEIRLEGRKDGQVKLRGLRIELGEVASCLASHPKVREAAAKLCVWDGQPVLAGYYCAKAEIPAAELIAYLSSFLPGYMVPAFLIRVERLPLTANGKVDLERLPQPAPLPSASGQDSPLVRQILAVFSRVLGKDGLTGDSDYFLSGGDSLNAMETLGELEPLLGRRLRVAELTLFRTARRLAEYLGDTPNTSAPAGVLGLTPAPQLERYPLTPIQQGIYVQSFLDPTGLAYHMAGAFRVEGQPDFIRLKQAFQGILDQDPLFRTAFVPEADGIWARVQEQVPFHLEILEAETFEEACKAFLRPFDLASPPLLRAAVWNGREEGWHLLVDLHHIIGDGASTPLLWQRMEHMLREGHGKPVPLSYLDYAWHLSQEGAEPNPEDRQNWQESLSPLPEPLRLPGDFPRPSHFDFRGDVYQHCFPEELSRRCRAFCEEKGITPFVLFLAAYGILLAEVSGNRDLLVGTPVSDRRRSQLTQICGPFVRTVPARLRPEKDLEIPAYLRQVQEEITRILDHPDCTLEEMLDMLELPRTTDGNPLYQTGFSLRPFEAEQLTWNGAPADYRPVKTGTAKMDLNVEAAWEKGHFQLTLEYASSLFQEDTIALYARSLQQILQGLIRGQAKTLGSLPLLAPADQLRLIDTPRHTFFPYRNLPIHQLIAGRAALAPESPAVIFHGQATSLGQLWEQAGGIAYALVQAGVLAGEPVGILCRRSPSLLAAMAGILRMGGVYVPLLPEYPAARIRSIVESAGIRKIVCDAATQQAFAAAFPDMLLPVEVPPAPDFEDAPVTGQDRIHILFTSGSTGRPKGVIIRHRSISNLFESVREWMEAPNTPILCASQTVFDIFITESLLPLAMGKTVVLADEEEMLLPWKMAELARSHSVGYMQFTASRLQMCLENQAFCQAAASLSFVIVGGEPVSAELAARFRACSHARLVNLYGPTEATVYTTLADLKEGEPVTIGHPIRNMRVYVMDEDGRPVMPTACGELCLAGEGVAEGYIGQPELTQAAFVPDPFFPGQQMYRSGDLGRLRADGTLDCFGRRDSQVKVNGVRIELTEITGAMLQSGLASQAAVLPRKKPDGSTELCAFYERKGADALPEALRQYLQGQLPPYMMPSRLIALEKMPFTANGKTDLQALGNLAQECGEPVSGTPAPAIPLPEPAAPTREATSAPNGSPTAETLLAIWQQVLGQQALSPDCSFFDQGGSSLAALSVLSHYYNEGWEMTLAQFYAHPTAREQVGLLCPDPKPASPPSPGCGPAADSMPRQGRSANSIPDTAHAAPAGFPRLVPPFAGWQAPKDGAVLVTGGTGFFGAHLLKVLLEKTGCPLICLARRGPESLHQALGWYFGAGLWTAAAGRIQVITGDITLPRLGLPEETYRALCRQVSQIWHCAADVRHYAADAGSRLTNVEGTEQVIRLALDSSAVLHAVSTASISGDFLRTQPETPAVFSEQDFDIGQNWQDNVYVQSKFLAEARIYAAMGQEGLQAKVYRLGRLVGRASDGVFQRNPETNAFYLMLRAGAALGAIPRSLASLPIDLTPVDVAAEAAWTLSGCPRTAFHVLSPEGLPLQRIAEAAAVPVPVLDDPGFARQLQMALGQGKEELLSPLVEFWNRARQMTPQITVNSCETHQLLRKQGFLWPETSPTRLLAAFAGMDSSHEVNL